jgi:hypothetical protein
VRRTAVIQSMHLGSRRLPCKLLEEVGGRALVDSGLGQLTRVGRSLAVSVLGAVPAGETELEEACRRWGVEVFPLTVAVGAAVTYEEVFAGWAGRLRDRFDWVFDANFACRPFLRDETVALLLGRLRTAERPFVSTLRVRGLVWDDQGEPVIGAREVADTTRNPWHHTLANLGYGFPVGMLGDEWALADAAEPFPVELWPEERIDIDTPADLTFARTVAAGRAAAHPRPEWRPMPPRRMGSGGQS